MKVDELMAKDVKTCGPRATLNVAAQIMWETDCGSVPVVGDGGEVVGMVTDRDICMAAYTRGAPLWNITVESAMSKEVHLCHPGDTVATAEEIMRRCQVRRLPVVDQSGHLVGLLSLADIARQAERERRRKKKSVTAAEVLDDLAAICEPRAHSGMAAA